LLVEKEDQVLLVRRAVEPGEGKWSLPSGFVEWDESPETAAVRECEEETGLEVGGIELLDVLHYTDDFRGPGINLLFRARVLGGQLHPGDDAGAVRFFSSAEIPPADQIAFEGHRATLTRWEARVSTLD
jgi:8-oxo-dGTP diphosphatase